MKYFLGRNLMPKLLAVLVALIVWVFVMNEQNPPVEGTFQVMLGSQGLAENLMVIDAPETVRVKVHGLRNAVGGAAAKDFRATVELKGLAAGQYNLPVSVAVPGGFELVEVIPDKVPIKIDAVRSRQISVEVRLTGPLVGEMILGNVAASPAAVTITGPKSLVDAVDKVVAPVLIRERTPEFSVESKLILLGADDKELKNLQADPAKVSVTGTLQTGAVTRLVEVKTVLTGNLPEGTVLRRVFTEPLKVELKGPKEILDKIDTIFTEPVSLTGLTKDTTKEVALQLKEGVTVDRKTVVIRITVGQER